MNKLDILVKADKNKQKCFNKTCNIEQKKNRVEKVK